MPHSLKWVELKCCVDRTQTASQTPNANANKEKLNREANPGESFDPLSSIPIHNMVRPTHGKVVF